MAKQAVIHKNYGRIPGRVPSPFMPGCTVRANVMHHMVRFPNGQGKLYTTDQLNALIKKIGGKNFRYAQ